MVEWSCSFDGGQEAERGRDRAGVRTKCNPQGWDPGDISYDRTYPLEFSPFSEILAH